MKKTGIQLIAEERQEQIEKHGKTITNDVDKNADFQLSDAAIELACVDMDEGSYDVNDCLPDGWDADLFNKMMSKPYKERLIIAGALIAAEIDRLQIIEDYGI